ncbi:MAG: cytochrome C [Burkholderiales bacterium RIFCSPLOWO2_12_FULL_64_99]|uniref:c-type cytochrome n=1 Tax=Aquabacterium sp. TaxID=1872578 RepID=UPI0008BA8D04|nr:c-type cytochrome [Aquabacterium sp.]OGB03270.1 MAG: cytochrome C [Burkholderiales bacterium RIFCSPHIGHO2_12_FULL_63_20]OGB67265.1 MAG: cytochrome C [Burkholderiales bacterium RIFCSPLOWO2_12_FULL_64_99]
MSQAPQSQESGHQGPISTPQQLMVAVAAAFIIPVIIIVLLVMYVSSQSQHAAGSNALSAQATADRIMPVGTVQIKLVSANAGPRKGEEAYKAQCAACHDAGMLGAPKFGDAAAWSARIGQGLATLASHAMKGFNAMPAQGGADLTDLEITRAVAFLANAGGAKFEEPAAPAAEAASAP